MIKLHLTKNKAVNRMPFPKSNFVYLKSILTSEFPNSVKSKLLIILVVIENLDPSSQAKLNKESSQTDNISPSLVQRVTYIHFAVKLSNVRTSGFCY